MFYTAKIFTDGIINISEVLSSSEVVSYDDLKHLISTLPRPFDTFDIISLGGEMSGFCLVIDDEGKLCNSPRVNYFASRLFWEGRQVDDLVCGDALLLHDYEPDTSEVRLLTSDEVDALKTFLCF